MKYFHNLKVKTTKKVLMRKVLLPPLFPTPHLPTPCRQLYLLVFDLSFLPFFFCKNKKIYTCMFYIPSFIYERAHCVYFVFYHLTVYPTNYCIYQFIEIFLVLFDGCIVFYWVDIP